MRMNNKFVQEKKLNRDALSILDTELRAYHWMAKAYKTYREVFNQEFDKAGMEDHL